MSRLFKSFIFFILAIAFCGCSNKIEPVEETVPPEEPSEETVEEVMQPEMLDFVDAHGNEYRTEISPSVRKHPYDWSCLSKEGQKMIYEGDPRYTCRLGVDVSYHEGNIDWNLLREEGFTFAIIRLGARGYGESGKVFLDQQFHHNMEEAKAAGFDVGVYFFSQAINEQEAEEEAEFVLENLKGYELDLPVVYDPENILDAEARTDDVTGEQFTENTIRFCQTVEAAGFDTMIYSNMLWEAYQFDLTQLSDYPVWYADYEPVPQTPYDFTFWQYTEKGVSDAVTEGLDDNYIDFDIQFIPVDEESTY